MHALNAQLLEIEQEGCDSMLERVIAHVEAQILNAEGAMSPNEAPYNVDTAHLRQIDICLNRFRATKIPAVSIRDYFHRLHLHCPFSVAKLLAIVHYLNVINVLYLDISKVLKKHTAHRLILATVLLASKVLDDRLIPQIRYAVVGGIDVHQILGLELALFFLLNGKCWLTEANLVRANSILLGDVVVTTAFETIRDTQGIDVIWSNVENRPAT